MKTIVWAGVLLAGLSAFGGDLENRTEVTGFGGANWFSGGGGTHGILGGSIGRGLGPAGLAYAELSYTPLGSADGFGASASAKLLDFQGGVKYNFVTSDRAEPYAIVSVGVGRFSSKVQSGGFSASESSIHFGLHLGLGSRIYFSDRWGIQPELRYGRYFGDGGLNSVRFTGGIFFQFGN